MAHSAFNQEMNFQQLLLHIGQSLTSEDVKALVFLCTDITQRSLNSVELFSDLCTILSAQDLLSSERPQLLQELLQTLQKTRLLRDFHLTHQEPRIELISPYRKLLYNISEDITDEELADIKFILNQTLPRRKLDENVTTLKLFLELEHMDLLSELNLDLLEKIFQSVCPMLNEKIKHFKEQAMRSVAEEINSSASMSFPVNQNQGFPYGHTPGPLYGGSNISSMGFTQLSVDPPNSSVYFPSIDNPGVSPQKVSNSVTNCSSVKECTDISAKPTAMLEEIGTYPMTGEKRGICLIINNYKFNTMKERNGTQTDQKCLEQVFQWLGFEVEVFPDCTMNDMLSVMMELGKRDHTNMDCVVCCILSHGLEGGVLGVDGQHVTIQQLTVFLNGYKCPSLIDKPKLFFIQACQGVREQQAVIIQTDGPTPCRIETDTTKIEDTIPSDADFLLGMATVPSFVSYREPSGTWFIQTLCKNLIEMVPRGWDLVSILTKVNADVSRKDGYPYGLKKQMPQPAFSLRKKVIFPVPPASPPILWP